MTRLTRRVFLWGRNRMDQDTRYQQIQSELSELFKGVPPEQLQLATQLIQRVAFMQITLEDLEEDIKVNGLFELTKTRPRKLRERPMVKTYNALIKNHNTRVKQLLDRLPSQKAEEAGDELLEFLRK